MAFPPPTKISIYSPTDLKTTTDDHLTPYLTTLPSPYTFTASHTHSTIRLSLGYTAVLIAGTLFYTDYKHGWDATKPYTLPACVLYFLLNGLLTFYIYFVEKGTVFTGSREGGQTLTLRSRGKKHSGSYELDVRYASESGKVFYAKTIRGEFMQWFSKEGYLQRKEFARWLGENVEVLGLAEKEREGRKEDRVEVSGSDIFVTDGTKTKQMQGGVIEVDTTPLTMTATPGGGKKGKSRKKA
jgi:Microsomal signal peptidase 25 kDa subunit (SPC25)